MKVRVLAAALLVATAQAAPSSQDVQGAATRVAQVLDGVLRNCPASFAKIGTPEKRCVGAGEATEAVRTKLGAALGDDLYGVWLSKDEQRSVYNWVKTPGGYVYLRLQADPDGRAQTLVYLDLPPSAPPAKSGENLTLSPTGKTEAAKAESAKPDPAKAEVAKSETAKPEPSKPETAKPEAAKAEAKPPVPKPAANQSGTAVTPPAPSTATAPAKAGSSTKGLAPVPFSRTLQLQAKRLNGPDVLAVQNRLIALIRPLRPGKGDGWYGPVTAATVKAFQVANGLPATGKVDLSTWNLLFSPLAKPFEGVK